MVLKNILFFSNNFFYLIGCELDGSIVEVTLAKPVDKNQYFRFTRGVSPSGLTANLPVKYLFDLFFIENYFFIF
jgi:hypothetical protein